MWNLKKRPLKIIRMILMLNSSIIRQVTQFWSSVRFDSLGLDLLCRIFSSLEKPLKENVFKLLASFMFFVWINIFGHFFQCLWNVWELKMTQYIEETFNRSWYRRDLWEKITFAQSAKRNQNLFPSLAWMVETADRLHPSRVPAGFIVILFRLFRR